MAAFETAQSVFPGAFEGGEIDSSAQAIVVVDILRGKGFKELGSMMVRGIL
jgi:hypothetical protein